MNCQHFYQHLMFLRSITKHLFSLYETTRYIVQPTERHKKIFCTRRLHGRIVFLQRKTQKNLKKHCRKSHFTKERPVLSKITKNIVAAFHFWQKIGEKSQRISFRCFRQNVYVLWFLHITCVFSCFLFISLLISSTSFTTTKYTFVKWKNRVME